MKKILILLFMFCFSMPAISMPVYYRSNGEIISIGDMRVHYLNNRISEIGDMDVYYKGE